MSRRVRVTLNLKSLLLLLSLFFCLLCATDNQKAVEKLPTDLKNCPQLDNHACCQRPSLWFWPLACEILFLSIWTEQHFFLFCVCVCFFCLCDAFVPKGILLYESLWWWLCKFHIFSSLHFLIAQVPSSHLASASVSPFSLLLLSLCPSWPSNIFLHHTLLTICAFPLDCPSLNVCLALFAVRMTPFVRPLVMANTNTLKAYLIMTSRRWQSLFLNSHFSF